MNKWSCDFPGCRNSCVGVGGAIGLRAIGWYFVSGGETLCPGHRPEKEKCDDPYTPDAERKEECPFCSGEREALRFQKMIAESLGEKASLEVLEMLASKRGKPYGA